MQDRYAGDIGDFGKFGLLREIQKQGLSVGVNWYHTKPLDAEIKSDGSFKQDDGKYIIPEKLCKCDESLASSLLTISNGDDRSIEALERAGLLTGAIYYNDLLSANEREDWHSKALKVLRDVDLVFLDPDNGMLVKSVKKKSAKSIKYAFYEDVADYVARGQSVIVYNHRSRKPEEKYFAEIYAKMQEYTGVAVEKMLAITFPRYSVRDYIAVSAFKEHYDKIQIAFKIMADGIWGQTGMCRVP